MPEAEREVWQRLVECLLRKRPEDRPTDSAQVAAWLRHLEQSSDVTAIKVRPKRFHSQRTLLLRERPVELLPPVVEPEPQLQPELPRRRRRNSWQRLKAAVREIF